MFPVLKFALFCISGLLSLALLRFSGVHARPYGSPQRPYSSNTHSPHRNSVRSPRGSTLVETKQIYSDSLNDVVRYSLFIPAGYSSSLQQDFPVIYWLHGSNGSGRSLEPLARKFNDAMSQGLMAESIIVFPESRRLSMWVNSKDKSYPSEDILINDLIPHLESKYRISDSRDDNYIAGFSMGGYGAARLGLKYSDHFGHIIMVGAGTLNESLENTPRANNQTKMSVLNTVYGGSDDYFYEQSPRFEALQNKKALLNNPISITIVVGKEDEVYSHNVDFSGFLREQDIRHRLVSLPGISHNLREYIMMSKGALFHNIW